MPFSLTVPLAQCGLWAPGSWPLQCRPVIGRTSFLDVLRLIPGGDVRQLHHMTLGLYVTKHLSFGVKLLLAAVAGALVNLPADEVHQFDLLIEPEVWGEADEMIRDEFHSWFHGWRCFSELTQICPQLMEIKTMSLLVKEKRNNSRFFWVSSSSCYFSAPSAFLNILYLESWRCLVPSCVCKSAPWFLTDGHRTDTPPTQGEHASPTNRWERQDHMWTSWRLTRARSRADTVGSDTYSSSSSTNSRSSSLCTSSHVFPSSWNKQQSRSTEMPDVRQNPKSESDSFTR